MYGAYTPTKPSYESFNAVGYMLDERTSLAALLQTR